MWDGLWCVQSHCCIFIRVMMDGTTIKRDLTLFSPSSIFSQRLYDHEQVPHPHPWASLSMFMLHISVVSILRRSGLFRWVQARKSGFRLWQLHTPARKLNDDGSRRHHMMDSTIMKVNRAVGDRACSFRCAIRFLFSAVWCFRCLWVCVN